MKVISLYRVREVSISTFEEHLKRFALPIYINQFVKHLQNIMFWDVLFTTISEDFSQSKE